jgi:DNA-binding transcriptional LysR family regulator
MPTMVSKGLLVLTTGRQFCERIISDRPDLNLLMVDCPVSFQPMTYYQLWHERSHAESSNRWLRNVLKDSVARLHAPSAQLI